MSQAELGGAFRLVLGQLGKIIKKSRRAATVEARPERRLANRLAARQRHALVIVRDAADHVGVRFDVVHNYELEIFLRFNSCRTPKITPIPMKNIHTLAKPHIIPPHDQPTPTAAHPKIIPKGIQRAGATYKVNRNSRSDFFSIGTLFPWLNIYK